MNTKDKRRTRRGSLVTVESKLLTVRAMLRDLRTPEDILVKTARSSDENVLTAAAGTGAADGETTVTVSQLATASRATAATAVPSIADTVASGPGIFEFRVGSGETRAIEISTSTTLGQLVHGINASRAGVMASAIDAGAPESHGYQLEIVANETGSGSDITVITDDTDLGVSVSAGTDAQLEVTASPDTIRQASNVVIDVIPGVTLMLKESGSSARVTVANDLGAIDAKVWAFVDAFNNLIEFVEQDRTITRRDAETSNFGALATGQMVRDVLDELRRNIRTWITDPSGDVVLSLARVGIAMQADGRLAFDRATFRNELALNPQNIGKVFGGVEKGTGVGELLYNSITEFARACGLGETVPERREDQTREMDGEVGNGEWATEAFRSNLVATFVALESSVNTIRSQGDFLLEHLSSTRNSCPGKQS